MRAKLFCISALALFAVALITEGCVRRGPVADPLGNVTLVPPYAPAQPGERTDRISVQYAVIAVANQVGLGYDWDISYKNTNPVCRQWIAPVIVRKTFPHALEMILGPVNLTYTVWNGKIILGPRL